MIVLIIFEFAVFECVLVFNGFFFLFNSAIAKYFYESVVRLSGGRSRAARPERLEEEYYPRGAERYERGYPREYHDYGPEYTRERAHAAHAPPQHDAYGHDYTRDAYARDEYGREYARDERERRRDRDPPDDYGPSRRALNAV